MPLVETEAIVLRTFRLGEADKIASLLTRQLGKFRAVASGAQRPKSRFGSCLEPLSYIRAWIYDRESRDLQRLGSAEVIESFFGVQRDYRIQVAMQYVSEVAEGYLPERELNERIFRLIVAVLRSLRHSGEVLQPLSYFNFWLLRLGGFLPDLERCGRCGSKLGDGPGYYGEGSEFLLCGECRHGAPRQLFSAARAVAGKLRGFTPDQWLTQAIEPRGLMDLQDFLEELVEGHLGKKLVTRSLLAKVG